MPTAPVRRVIHLVPHTHWDREWYLPWQRFRMRLVELVDGLLDEMARDERIRFTLDGQTATIDDYLEIRPEREADLRALVAGGRLAVGPWRILMDEFLVSGETIVRNLEMGVRRAEELGRVMSIGYLPDMFGHIAQMPQLLARAGIRDAVVWRGVPAAIHRHAFTWSAPDGSAVRTEYLLGGYGNASDLLSVGDRVAEKVDAFAEIQRSAFGRADLLAMYGEDHSIPRAGYAELIAAFNRSQDRVEIRIETLPDALAAVAHDPPEQAWQGELRSGARANVLMGVTSHRVEVKAAAGRVERLLERTVEPLWALHGGAWPAAYLEEAWRRVVENSAHDSICACSAEPTVAQVLLRYAEAEQIASGLLDRLLADLAGDLPPDSFVALNPTPAERADIVELDVQGDPDGLMPAIVDGSNQRVSVQELAGAAPLVREERVADGDVVAYLRRRLHGRELYGFQLNGVVVEDRSVTVDVDRVADPPELDVDELLARVAEATGEPGGRADDEWRLVVRARARRRLLARPVVPALGWTVIRAASDGGPQPAIPHPVAADDRSLSNGLVSVRVADDGSLEVRRDGTALTAAGRIVDGGDAGDSYNYAPPPSDRLVDTPASTTIASVLSGPLVGRIRIERAYDWPVGLVDDLSARTAATVRTVVGTTVELRADEPFVRLTVELDNRASDHRTRLHVPLGAPAVRSVAEGQFAIVERGLTMEGGHGEVPLPTFPAHGFAAAGRVAVLVEHVTEYELVRAADDGPAADGPAADGPAADRAAPDRPADEIALTLLRATGLISRDVHPYRDDPAGPVIAAPTGQAQGRRTVRLGLMPLVDGPEDRATMASVLEAAERFRHPFVVGEGRSVGRDAPAAARARGISIDGPGAVMTSLRRRQSADGEVFELRLVREAPGAGSAVLRGPFTRARAVDLLGRPLGDELLGAWRAAPGRLEVALDGWEIRTIQLAGTPPPDA